MVAGELGGHRLRVPDRPGVRPLGERAREALFSRLHDRVDGARVLDAYAGSAVLAAEALSRGARSAVVVELDRQAAATARDNLDRLGLADRAVVVVAALEAFAADPDGQVRRAGDHPAAHRPVDLVLLDPPYRDPLGPVWRALSELRAAGWLADDAAVALHRRAGSDDPAAPRWLASAGSRLYGDSEVRLLRVVDGDEPADG